MGSSAFFQQECLTESKALEKSKAIIDAHIHISVKDELASETDK